MKGIATSATFRSWTVGLDNCCTSMVVVRDYL